MIAAYCKQRRSEELLLSCMHNVLLQSIILPSAKSALMGLSPTSKQQPGKERQDVGLFLHQTAEGKTREEPRQWKNEKNITFRCEIPFESHVGVY